MHKNVCGWPAVAVAAAAAAAAANGTTPAAWFVAARPPSRLSRLASRYLWMHANSVRMRVNAAAMFLNNDAAGSSRDRCLFSSCRRLSACVRLSLCGL